MHLKVTRWRALLAVAVAALILRLASSAALREVRWAANLCACSLVREVALAHWA